MLCKVRRRRSTDWSVRKGKEEKLKYRSVTVAALVGPFGLTWLLVLELFPAPPTMCNITKKDVANFEMYAISFFPNVRSKAED